MRNLLRTFTFALAAAFGLGAAAQGHTIYVVGHMTPCDPSLWGSTVNVHVYGFQSGPVAIATPMNENCYYYVELNVPDTAGFVLVGASCANGSFVQDTAYYSLTPPFTTDVVVDLDCGNAPIDCEACFTLEQTAPFTATFSSGCSSFGTDTPTFLWDFSDAGAVPGATVTHTYNGPGQYAVCLNMSTDQGCFDALCQQVYVDEQGNVSFDPPTGCQACILPVQYAPDGEPVPFVVTFTSCSTGDGALTYSWINPNGNIYTDPEFLWQFDPGTYASLVCLTISDGAGCTSSVCDTIYFDENGWLTNSEPWYDCLGVAYGNDLPGSPCVTGNNTPGTWSPGCQCVSNEPTECEAGFWVIQAFQNGDTLSGEPVPFELWIWNLSSGGTGIYQFVWDFGDGTTSTEAFPTHVYATSGPYTLCLTITDSEGCTDTYCEEISVDDDGFLGMSPGGGEVRSALTVNVIQQLPASVNEQPALETTNLWPNPATDQLNLQLHSSRSGRVEVSIINLDGRTLHSSQVALMNGTNRVPLDVNALPAGMYMVRLTDGQNVATMRFVKQ